MSQHGTQPTQHDHLPVCEGPGKPYKRIRERLFHPKVWERLTCDEYTSETNLPDQSDPVALCKQFQDLKEASDESLSHRSFRRHLRCEGFPTQLSLQSENPGLLPTNTADP